MRVLLFSLFHSPMLFCVLVKVLVSIIWRGLRDAAKHSDDLKDLYILANSLPSVLLASRASSTVDKYPGGFTRWKAWAQLHTIPILPASPFHVSLFLRYLMQDAKIIYPMNTAIYSLDLVHRLAGDPSPCSHPREFMS